MIPYNFETDDTAPVAVRVDDSISVMQYEAFVCNLVKQRGSLVANLEHMAMGIGGEAGEIIDAVKRHTVYEKPLDRENVIEEMGDHEFFMAGLRQLLGISQQEVLNYNVLKLQQRYSTGSYSDQQAQDRADKQPQQDTRPDLVIIDVTKPQPTTLSAEQVAAVDDTAGLK